MTDPAAPALISHRSTAATDADQARLTHWRSRLVRAVMDPSVIPDGPARLKLYLFTRAILGTSRGFPRCGDRTKIDAEGRFFADLYAVDGSFHEYAYTGVDIATVIGAFRHCCNAAGFVQDEADEFFTEFRRWAGHNDARVADIQKESLGL